MEPILIISNLVLIGLTGTYAWLTNKNVKQIQQESAYYRSIVEKQLRFTALPHLYWDLRPTESTSSEPPLDVPPNTQNTNVQSANIQSASTQNTSTQNTNTQSNGHAINKLTVNDNGLALEVFNISNVPAYDVHVSLIGAYTEEGLGIATFMRSHVQPRHRKYPLQSDKVGYYGVRNAIRLSLLPTQQKIVLALPFPIQPVDVYTLVQYRELSGENYYQVCCFSAIDESGAYRANILEPSEIQSMERLHLFDLEDFALPETRTVLKTDEKEDLPYYLADFIDLWNHAISSRLISNVPASLEEELPVKASYDF